MHQHARAMERRRLLAIIAAASASAACLGVDINSASQVSAAPIFNARLLARNVTDGESFFNSLVFVDPGDVLEYQVVGNMAPLGTVYSGSSPFTITSLTAPVDGANSLRFNIFETTADGVQVNFSSPSALASGWAGDSTNSPGALSARGNGYNDLTGIRPIRVPGSFSAVTPEILFTGSFTVSTANSYTSLLQLKWSSGAGSLHVNGSGLAKFPSLTSETGANPYVNCQPLTLSTVLDFYESLWYADASGNWSGGFWSQGTPDAYPASYLGTFGPVITAPRTITMNASTNPLAVQFNSNVPYTVNGPAALRLANDPWGVPGLSVNNGAHLINAPLTMVNTSASPSAGIINTLLSSSALTIAGAVTMPAPGLEKRGPGTVIISGTNLYSGPLKINGGTVRLAATNAISGSVSFTGTSAGRNLDLNGFDLSLPSLDGAGGAVHLGTGTLSVNAGSFAGAIDGSGGLTLGAGGTFTLAGGNSYSGVTTLNSGSLLTTNATVNMALGAVSGAGAMSNTGTGTVTVSSIRTAGALNIYAGTVRIAGQLGNASTSVQRFLPARSTGARFDLNDSKLIVQFGTAASPMAATRTAIIVGRGGTGFSNATWNGAGGITSTAAAPGGVGDGSNPGDGVSFAVGYIENSMLAQLGLPSYSSFGGQTVDSGSLLIRFTKGADANLDGKVNSDDLTIVSALFNNPASGDWFLGDFDYDGICDSDDVTVMGALYDPSAPALSSGQLTAQFGEEFAAAFEAGRMGLVGVPEPAFIWVLGTGVLCFGGRARRRRRSASTR